MVVQLTAPVVVGVDGTQQGLGAVQLGVVEARRAGCGVRLVHVLPELAATSPIVPLAGFEIFDEVGIAALRDKSTRLTGFLEGLMRAHVPEAEILTPPEPATPAAAPAEAKSQPAAPATQQQPASGRWRKVQPGEQQ